MSVQHTRRVNAQVPQLAFGVDYHRVSGTDTGDIFADTRPQIRTDIGRGKQDGLGAYALASFNPTPAFDILASLRWDYWRNFDGFDGTTGRGAVPTKTANAVSPRIGARYRLTSLVAVRAAGYGAFNAPNLDNLYRAFSTPGFIGLPNSQLDPERARGVEAGVDLTHALTRVQITVCNATIRDAITSRNVDPSEPIFPPGFEFASFNINAGKLRSRGVELESTHVIRGAWILDGAYTLADSVITDNPLDPTMVGVQIQGVPKHAANAGVAYEPSRGFGGPDGKARKQLRYESLGKISRKEADEILRQRLAEYGDGKTPTRSCVAFATLAVQWAVDVLPTKYKHSTQKNHRHIMDKHLIPRFGEMPSRM